MMISTRMSRYELEPMVTMRNLRMSTYNWIKVHDNDDHDHDDGDDNDDNGDDNDDDDDDISIRDKG